MLRLIGVRDLKAGIRWAAALVIVVIGPASFMVNTTAYAEANPGPSPATDAKPPATEAAPPNNSIALQEIVVTAQKREQNIQNVGISITAVSGDQLRVLGLTDSVDISKIAPNVTVSGSYGGMMSQFSMRGVTQNDFNDHVESVIATYVDDTYVAMQQGQMFALFDLDRVEALKGPQGTLFGRNATGGLVHFITKRPTDTFESFADLTYGSFNQVRFEGAVGGPLTTGVNARFSVLGERYDGFLINKYPQQTFTPSDVGRPQGDFPAPGAGSDLGGVKLNGAARGQITAELAEHTNFWVSVFYDNFQGSSAPYQQPVATIAVLNAAGVQTNELFAGPNQVCEVLQAGKCAPGFGESSAFRAVPGASFFGYKDPDGEGLVTSSDYGFNNGSQTRTWGASTKLTSQFEAGNLTWISDYKDYWKHFFFDLTADPANGYFWIADSKEHTLSQELRFDGNAGPLQWVAGVYFLNIDNRSVSGLGSLPNSAYAAGGVGFDQPRIASLRSQSYSLFTQGEYSITDTVKFIAGVRGSRELKNYDFDVLFVPTRFPSKDPTDWNYTGGSSSGPFLDKTNETLSNWKAQLNWQPDRDLLIYGGITQGAKAGSFNAGDPSLFATPDLIPYKPERLVSYEIGAKSTLDNRRLTLNGAVFYYDYHDYQAARWTGLSSIIINADAYFYGGEMALNGRLTDDLDASLNVGYQKNLVKNVPIGGQLKNVETTFAPNWTSAALLRYTYPGQIAGGYFSIQGSATYQTREWTNLDNFDATRLPGYFLGNARLSWGSSDSRYQIALFVNNIFDKRYDTISFDESYLTGANLNSPGKPRWIGGNVRIKF